MTDDNRSALYTRTYLVLLKAVNQVCKPVIVMSSLSHIAALHDGCFYVGAGTVLVTTLVVVWTWASSAVRLCCSRPVNYVGKHAVITGARRASAAQWPSSSPLAAPASPSWLAQRASLRPRCGT